VVHQAPERKLAQAARARHMRPTTAQHSVPHTQNVGRARKKHLRLGGGGGVTTFPAPAHARSKAAQAGSSGGDKRQHTRFTNRRDLQCTPTAGTYNFIFEAHILRISDEEKAMPTESMVARRYILRS
jgi:hypothetical protein